MGAPGVIREEVRRGWLGFCGVSEGFQGLIERCAKMSELGWKHFPLFVLRGGGPRWLNGPASSQCVDSWVFRKFLLKADLDYVSELVSSE